MTTSPSTPYSFNVRSALICPSSVGILEQAEQKPFRPLMIPQRRVPNGVNRPSINPDIHLTPKTSTLATPERTTTPEWLHSFREHSSFCSRLCASCVLYGIVTAVNFAMILT